ncbi:MAG: Na/Pi cotransporter family protein, partial [Planctomycetota bacterium]|jgi:phosphate:Na+ symporter
VAIVVLIAMLPLESRLPAPAPELMPLVIANLHTGFNVVVAIVGLPALGLVTRLAERMIRPPSVEQAEPFAPKFIGQGPIGGMALALGQSRREILHMAEILRGMLDDVWTAMSHDDAALAREVGARDDYVDELDNQIKRYLTRLVREESDDYDADEQMRQLRYLTELETIGDIIDKNIAELVLKKIRLGARFSDEGKGELEEFHRHVIVDLETAATAIGGRDRRLAHQLIRDRVRLKQLGNELRDRHFARLNAGLSEAHETSAIHLDLITHLERVNSALVHVAYAILADADTGEWRGETPRE